MIKDYIKIQLDLLKNEPGIFLATASLGFLLGQLLQFTWILVPAVVYVLFRLYKRYANV